MKERSPSFDHLHVFEVASRHLSFKKAAEELHVTPAAVGQRIRSLESQLEVNLFKRMTREIILTEDGQQLALAVREGIQAIQKGINKLKRASDSTLITISTTAVFADRWLLSKLPAFNLQYPDTEVRIIAGDLHADFERDSVDLAIRFGRGSYKGCESIRLMEDYYVPVCQPQLAAEMEPWLNGRSQSRQTLIYCDWLTEIESEPNWTRWFNLYGKGVPNNYRVLRFTQESLAIHAALTGQGVALVHLAHVENELSLGSLVKPFDKECVLESDFHYYLVSPESREDRLLVKQFRQWLFKELDSL